MQVWPRVRANRPYARVRHWTARTEKGPLGFAGYKVGMTHVTIADTRKTSLTKGMEITRAATIVECPPIKIVGVRFYAPNKNGYGIAAAKQIIAKADKELERKFPLPKKTTEQDMAKINPAEYVDIRLVAYTQPKLTGRGNKKPEMFEIGLGGNVQQKFETARERLGKEITIQEVFKEGQQIDVQSITKGKGFQGPVKRFGVSIRQHKSEKTIRGPGSLGPWRGQSHVMYRVAHAGQMGYHQRIDYNKKILKIDTDTKQVTPKGGFHKYGLIHNSYVIIDGSIPGVRNRIVRFTSPRRENKKITPEIMQIKYIFNERG